MKIHEKYWDRFSILQQKFRYVALRTTVNVQAALELSKEVRHGINSYWWTIYMAILSELPRVAYSDIIGIPGETLVS